MTGPLLSIRGVSAYYGSIAALKGIDVEVMPGEIVTIIGANGAGKSTLMMTICGNPQARTGNIVFEGRDITRLPTHEIMRMKIAQSPEGRRIFPRMTVFENLQMGAATAEGGDFRSDLARVYALFPILESRRNQRGGTLSGGEQQMLSIGRALMTSPSIILLDEATEGLAPKLRDEIWSTVKQITGSGIAAIIVDKNLNDLLALADRNTIMAKGEIVFDGSSAALRADEALIHRHLGV